MHPGRVTSVMCVNKTRRSRYQTDFESQKAVMSQRNKDVIIKRHQQLPVGTIWTDCLGLTSVGVGSFS